MKKVNDLANELGVTRQGILYYVEDKSEIIKIDGVNYIEDDVEKRISKKILYKQAKKNNKANGDKQLLNTLDEVENLEHQLRKQDKTIAFLQKQLNEKDKQIENFQKLLTDQQHITLDYIKKSDEQEKRIEHLQAPANVSGVKKGQKRGLIGKLIDLI